MKIYDIIIIILFIATLITVFWYLLGSSPTLEQGLLILILTFLFTIYGSQRSQDARLRSLESSFFRLAEDFKEHIEHKK